LTTPSIDGALPPPLRWTLGIAFGVIVALLLYGMALTLIDAFDRQESHPLRILRPQLVTNEQAHMFTLPDHRGEPHSLSDLRGRPVVLNFWSITCQPCRDEMPWLIQLSEAGRSRGTFSVVTVCVDEGWEQVRELFDTDEPPLTVLFDPERRVVRGEYGTERYPETFLIDRHGKIRARFDGARPWSDPVVLNLIENL
jgi:thiol-disulfide isomerase/thioredoxin